MSSILFVQCQPQLGYSRRVDHYSAIRYDLGQAVRIAVHDHAVLD